MNMVARTAPPPVDELCLPANFIIPAGLQVGLLSKRSRIYPILHKACISLIETEISPRIKEESDGRTTLTHNDIAKNLSIVNRTIVALDNVDSDLLGLGTLSFDIKVSDIATIDFLAVKSSRQKHGVGRMILQVLEYSASANGCQSIQLDPLKSSDDFYARCGYAISPYGHRYKRL